jgi:hypothetical protein
MDAWLKLAVLAGVVQIAPACLAVVGAQTLARQDRAARLARRLVGGCIA